MHMLLQAASTADAGQTQGGEAAVSDDIRAEWRMRAGSALDDLKLDKADQYDELNIQVPSSHLPTKLKAVLSMCKGSGCTLLHRAMYTLHCYCILGSLRTGPQ